MGELVLELTVPVLRLGPLRVDPIAAVAGRPLGTLLGALLRGPPRATADGEVLTLALPEGLGAAIPLGLLGELGLRHDRGYLVLSVPLPVVGGVMDALGGCVVRRAPGLRFAEDLWLDLPTGRPLEVAVAGTRLAIRRIAGGT